MSQNRFYHSLTHYYDFYRQVDCDQPLSENRLNARDRQLGQQVESQASDHRYLRHWLYRRQQDNPRPQTKTLQSYHQIYTIISLMLGVIFGMITTRAIMQYDGSQPINLINVISILVFAQLIILALFFIASPPFCRRLKEALFAINPAFLITKITDKIGQKHTHFDKPVSLPGREEQQVLTAYILTLSQKFAVAFNLGIIALILFLAASSDLAFGWNTTLNIDADFIHRICHWLSLPWQSFMPQASPSLELVELSRYYRLDDVLSNKSLLNSDYARRLGDWWLFILMCVICYGLIPRIIIWWLLERKLKQTVFGHLSQSVEFVPILHRMQTPLVATQAQTPAPENEPNEVNHKALRPELNLNIQSPVIIWSNASINNSALKTFGITPQGFYETGGNYALSQDKKALQEVTATKPEGLVFVVKGWEPPTFDFIDILTLARKLLKEPQHPILVILSSLKEQALTQDHIASWETMLEQTGDARLFVEPLSPEHSK